MHSQRSVWCFWAVLYRWCLILIVQYCWGLIASSCPGQRGFYFMLPLNAFLTAQCTPHRGRPAACEKLNIRAVHRGLTVSIDAEVPSVQFDSVTPVPLLVWSGPEWATPASLPRWCETDGGRRPETWSTVCRRDDTQRPCCWTAVCACAASTAPSSGKQVRPVEHRRCVLP
jgi:hypothetical protein